MLDKILKIGLGASLLTLLLQAPAMGQVADYQQQAGYLSTLYRGRIPSVYPFRFNGTYFLETRTFTPGDVMYNGKLYQGVYLNLDAYVMELVVKASPDLGGTQPDRDQIAWFTMGGRKFVNLRYMGYPEAQEGFYELVRDGKTPLLNYARKNIQTFTQPSSLSGSSELDGNFDPQVITFFLRNEQRFVLEGGKLKKLGKRAWKRRLKEEMNPLESPLAGADAWHPTHDFTEGVVPASVFKDAGLGLPDGYFAEKKVDTTSVNYAQNALTATYRNKVYTIGEAGQARGGRATITGTVFEAESGLPLPGTVIFDENTATYVRSDARGRYRITLPVGENVLNFNAEGKEDLALRMILNASGEFDVVMTDRVTVLKAALVSAESMRQHRSTAIGLESVSMATANKVPSAFGEGDIIKAVLTLPGVKSVGEASGGLNVRGGSADQNLVLFNENTIYNPSHLFGMFSAFNPDIVSGVELYKSSIPAQYGGRISSVLSVDTKEGDRNRVRGSLGIGLLTSRGHIEGPLGKKTTFVAGARTTYSDWILGLLPENSAYAGGGAGFTDANVGLTHRFDEQNSLQLFGYFATDRFSFSGDTTFNYSNINASLAFRHKEEDGSSFKISGGYDHYTNIVGDHHWDGAAYDLQTFIRQAFLKGIRVRPIGDSHTLTYGADLVGYALDPGIIKPFGDVSLRDPAALERELGVEPDVYLSDTWAITDEFSVDGGLRLSSFLALNPSKFYMGPELRLSGKYSPMENLSFKAGVNTMRQYIHLISNTASVSPMDTWRLSSAALAPTTGWQAAAGAYWTLLGSGIDLSLEAYYKQSSNALDYKSGAQLVMNPNLADELVPVRGRAYGVELMVKKPAGKLTGWVSYSYSRSQLREMNPEGNQINGGAWYNASYDKPHEFKLVGNYALTHRFSLSLNIDYSTGRPITVPIGSYFYGGAYHLAYSARNSHRMPDYFRIDAALNIDPGHYLKAFAHMSVTIGVYNVTGRKNPYSVFFRPSYGGYNGYMISVFGSQVPYINLNILF